MQLMFLATAVVMVLGQAPNAALDDARRFAAALRFSDALERLAVAAVDRDLTQQQQHELVELSARCLMAEGQRDAALEVFSRQLRLEPDYEPNREATPPKVLEVFDAAKQQLYARDFVQLERLRAPAGRVTVKLVDPWHRARLVQRHERRGAGGWVELPLELNAGLGSFDAVVPAGATLEWYVEVRGAEQELLAHLGTADEPQVVAGLPVEVVAVLDQPVATGRRSVGWVLVGAAAVAVAVATGLQINGWNLRTAARDPSRPPGEWADTAQRAETEGVRQTTWATSLFVGAGVGVGLGVGLVTW